MEYASVTNTLLEVKSVLYPMYMKCLCI